MSSAAVGGLLGGFVAAPPAGFTFGMQTRNGTVPASGDRAWASVFAATGSGTITAIRFVVVSGASGNSKAFVYSNKVVGGIDTPDALLGVSASVANSPAGTIVAAVSIAGIVSGTKYWLGIVSDGSASPDCGGNSGLAGTLRQVLANGTFSFASPPATFPTPDANDAGQCLQVWATG